MKGYELQFSVNGPESAPAPRPLEGRGMLPIGRQVESGLRLDYREISKQHALLAYDAAAGVFALTDLGSTQGTFIDSVQIAAGQETALAPGQAVTIGRVTLRVVRSGDGLTDPTAEAADPAPSEEADPTVLEPEPADAPGFGSALRRRANALVLQIQELLLQRVNFVKIQEQAENDQQARETVREQIAYIIHELVSKGRVGREQVAELEKIAVQDILGFGPIQDLLEDPRVSEVMVNSPDQIYFELEGRIHACQRSFQNEDHVRQILMRLIKNSARRIDEGNPTVNARLPDGSRLHAVIPPLALDGTVITIRKFHHNLAVGQLVQYGTLNAAMARFIETACRERQNIIVSGGTGSGKTTMLNCLSSFIAESERIVTVEDTAELALQQRHVIRLQARPANTEGTGAVSIQRLVVEALRMRPDRIIVGECRHGEALDMLQAMNTGHDGSMTTLHANSARDALSRLETMTLMSGMELPIAAIRQQIASAVNLIVQIGRLADGSRRVLEIAELTGMENGEITLQPVFQFQQRGFTAGGRVEGQHAPTGHICAFLKKMGARGAPIPDELFEIAPVIS